VVCLLLQKNTLFELKLNLNDYEFEKYQIDEVQLFKHEKEILNMIELISGVVIEKNDFKEQCIGEIEK
jgi:hypothetical protein